MYANVTLKLENRPQVLAIPAEAVIAGKTPSVFVINAKNEIEQRLSVRLRHGNPGSIRSPFRLKGRRSWVVVGNHSEIVTGQTRPAEGGGTFHARKKLRNTMPKKLHAAIA